MNTAGSNNIQPRQPPQSRRVEDDDDDSRRRIPDRPVDQLDDEKKKRQFKDALSKMGVEKKSTDLALEAEDQASIGRGAVSPFDLARSKLIAKSDEPTKTGVAQHPQQTVAPQTPRAAPVSIPATPTAGNQARAVPQGGHYVGTSPPPTPTSTPTAPPHSTTTRTTQEPVEKTPQLQAPATPTATPPAAPKVQSLTTPDTAPTGMGKVSALGEDDGFPQVVIGTTLPKVDVVKELNPVDPSVVQALQSMVPRVSTELTVQPTAEPAPVTATQAARVVAVQLAEELIRNLTTVTTGDRVETKIELRNPPLFDGVTVVVTEFKTAAKEFNVAFFNLYNPEARALIESRANQQQLKEELIAKGYTLHNVVIESQSAPIITQVDEAAQLERDRRERPDDGTFDNEQR